MKIKIYLTMAIDMINKLLSKIRFNNKALALVSKKQPNKPFRPFTVTVPNNIIPLHKAPVLLNSLYSELYEFIINYNGPFESYTHDSYYTDSIDFFITKGNNIIKLRINKDKDIRFDDISYDYSYEIWITHMGKYIELSDFPKEAIKELCDKFEDCNKRKLKDQQDMNTIHALKGLLEQ